MRKRSLFIALSLLVAVLLAAAGALAAPMAKILRIDPRASLTEGGPVLTVVVDLVQSKRVSEATAECETLSGDARWDCQANALEKPKALFTPFPYPEKNGNFLVTVDGSAYPTQFVSAAKWGDSLKQPDVGTAWLIMVDAGGSMGNRLAEAKELAKAFVNSMTQWDIVDIMAFDGHQVVKDSKWLTAAQRGQASSFVDSIPLYGSWGRTRPLNNIIRSGVTDGFNTLGNIGSTIQVPLHQALVVLSDGSAGTDPLSTEAGALTLQQYLSKGRFPEDNTALPKTPLPVISIYMPRTQIEELSQNSEGFMRALANPDYGGFYTVVRQGQAGRGARIVGAVRDRFNAMYILKFRVSCIAPNVQQTFQLVFANTQPLIGGDATFKDVPVGIDPTTWPLDVNVDYTVQMAKKNPVTPGGTFKVYGNFCWGGDKSRAEVYFLPKNQPAPQTVAGGDIESAKRAQQQLIAMNMRGSSVEASDTFVEFTAPDSDSILLGTGDKAQVRLIVYDNKAKRTSPADAAHILTLAGAQKGFPIMWVAGGAFAFLIVLLLVIAIARGGGGKRARAAAVPPPAPVMAGQPYPGAPGASPYGGAPSPQPYGAPSPQPYGAPPAAQPQVYGAPSPQQPMSPPAAAPQAQPGGDFMYGGKPAQYGLTGAQPSPLAAPPNPYGAPQPAAGAAVRAVISGAAGTYPIAPGQELGVGRDSARCQVILQEPRVSAYHAVVRFDGSQIYLRDEGSNNGTFLNGNRLAAGVMTPVPPGSMIRFGPVEFVARLE